MTSQSLRPRHDRHFVGTTRHNAWSWGAKIYRVYLNKIWSVGLWKCLYDHCLANKAYFSAITVKNIYESFTHKMAAKASWHRNYVTVTLCIYVSAKIILHKCLLQRPVAYGFWLMAVVVGFQCGIISCDLACRVRGAWRGSDGVQRTVGLTSSLDRAQFL